MVSNTPLTGIVHGKMVELDRPSGLPDGTRVKIEVDEPASVPSIERLRRAFGSWSDDPEGIEEFLKQVRRDRDNDPR